MSQEAMKLALEALEDIKDDCSGCEFEWLNDYPLQAKAKLALEEALAKQEQGEPDKYVMDIECTKCGAKQSGTLTVHTTPQQRKPLTDEMTKQMKERCDSMEMRGAFADGWLSAEAAHGIKGEA